VSGSVLDALRAAHAFDGSPLHVDLPAYHVPFDDSGRDGTESGVRRAAQSAERLGLRGPIGCGKTSVLRYALDHRDSGVAPIWVSVAFDEEAVILDVRRFAAHLVQSVIRDAERARSLSEPQRTAILTAAAAKRPLPATERKLAGRLAAKFWIASSEVAREVTRSLAGVELDRPAAEILDAANGALEVIADTGRQPVIVVDDSDSITRRAASRATREELVGAFFGPVLRSLTGLHAGCIVAIHDEYLEMQSFAIAQRDHGALERLLPVPEVVSGQLARILDVRTGLAASVGRADAFSQDAVSALAELNRGRARRNLRSTLGITHDALVSAIDRGAELIEASDIERAAIQRLGSGEASVTTSSVGGSFI
jgi:hypothetical protein